MSGSRAKGLMLLEEKSLFVLKIYSLRVKVQIILNCKLSGLFTVTTELLSMKTVAH
jgi:hypothetical protein